VSRALQIVLSAALLPVILSVPPALAGEHGDGTVAETQPPPAETAEDAVAAEPSGTDPVPPDRSRVPPEVRAEQNRKRERKAEIERLRAELGKQPDDDTALSRLFELLTQDHDGKGAIEVAETFVKKNPSNAAGYLVLGRAHFWQGDYDLALLQLQRSVALDPASFKAHFWHSRMLEANGDRAGALASLEKTLQLDPENLGVIATKAHFLEDAKRFEEAAALWESVVAKRSEAAGREDISSKAHAQLCRQLARDGPKIIGLGAEGVTLQLFSFNKVPAVKVLLNQKLERYLAIDLSSRENVLTAEISRALQLQEFGGPSYVKGDVVAGVPAQAILTSMRMGPLALTNVPASVNPYLKYPTEKLAGILGRRFLSDFLVTIDYVGRTITFAPRPEEPLEGIPLYLNSGVLVDARSRGADAGKFLVDTSTYTPGPVSLVWVQEKLGKNALSPGVTPIFYRNYSFYFTMPDLVIGGVRWRSYRATAVDFRSLSERIGTEVTGVLANSLLQDTRVTLDMYHRRMRIDRLRQQKFRAPQKLPLLPAEEGAASPGAPEQDAPEGESVDPKQSPPPPPAPDGRSPRLPRLEEGPRSPEGAPAAATDRRG
jgi:tetratricopeptide (TPR) repeat protein